ncbi:MAG: hypothetical protein ACE5IP_11755 [Terriglobia bacterium]
MAAINQRRVWLGALAGFGVWALWSGVVNFAVLADLYPAAQGARLLLPEPRYNFFLGAWFLTLFLLSYVIAWLYASVRATQGPGPKTALSVGILVGFAAGFPTNFATSTWSPLDRIFPLWWTLELWVGAVLAALVAGWLYKE